MLFEWDENKRRRNVSHHEVDFIDMVQVFDGRPTFTYRSPRNDEDRWGHRRDRRGQVLSGGVDRAWREEADHLRLQGR
jgi:uncharacterized DUF497 family protein